MMLNNYRLRAIPHAFRRGPRMPRPTLDTRGLQRQQEIMETRQAIDTTFSDGGRVQDGDGLTEAFVEMLDGKMSWAEALETELGKRFIASIVHDAKARFAERKTEASRLAIRRYLVQRMKDRGMWECHINAVIDRAVLFVQVPTEVEMETAHWAADRGLSRRVADYEYLQVRGYRYTQRFNPIVRAKAWWAGPPIPTHYTSA